MNAISKENRNYFMGIAIILVILHHLCLRIEGSWHMDSFPLNVFYWGQIGVDIFLFVSAYGCCASWENNKWWQYILHRVKRIYPQYIIFLLIVLCLFYADASILHRLKMAVYSLISIAPIYRLGVQLEWYIPSLIMMYMFLPLLYLAIENSRRYHGGGYLIVFVIMCLPWLLKEPLIYYPFLARFPVIICGVIAYVHRDNLTYLVKIFAFAMLLTLTTKENMVIHSMMIPFMLAALSMVSLEKKPLDNALSFCGKHSLEIFLAQTISTQFIMQRYFWIDKWLSLLIIVGLTIVFSFLFWGVQRLFDVTYKSLIVKQSNLNDMFRKLKRYLKDPYFALGCDMIQKCPDRMSDEFFIRTEWGLTMDYPLDLKNPKTFCEKLQWLKLHDHNPLYHKLVDKYEVKQWVADKIGAEHVVKCYGVYDQVDEIDYKALPDQFVLKCTHDSGGLLVCKDKSKLDKSKVKELFQKGLNSRDYYLWKREWAYKDVKPRIIAEEYIDSLGKPESVEYKITCIHGKVKMITVCSGIAHVEYEKRFNDHFDREGNRLPFSVNYKPAGLNLPEKKITDELIRLSEILSAGIPQVRVDWYVHNGQIYFGEMTFYTWAGFMNYEPKEYDRIMGDWLDLNFNNAK